MGPCKEIRQGSQSSKRISTSLHEHTRAQTAHAHTEFNSSELSFSYPELIFEGSRGAPSRGTAKIHPATSYWDTTYPCLSV